MGGYTGRTLKVDLTSGRTSISETPEDLRNEYLGGRGMAVAMMGRRVTLPWDDPGMPLICATGPLVGTQSPTSGRSSIVSRSPLTGTVFDCSVGGRFGTALKKAGFDTVEITGVAKDWVVLSIENGQASLEGAGRLAGMNTGALGRELRPCDSWAAIGRSGERKVRFASLVVDGHYAAGRGGLGAVMGAKRLKAVTLKGNRPITVEKTEDLRIAREDIMRLLRASPAVFGEFGLAEFGTAALVDLIHARRMEPTGNFRRTFFDGSSRYSGYAMKAAYGTRKAGCAGCPILCKKLGRDGTSMPEFETASHFGALNECGDLVTVVEANRMCNDYGLDTISAASTIACHAEIEGVRLSPQALLDLLEDIAELRTPQGRALAEGSYRYTLSKGCPELSMSVKGLELPAYDPRGAYGMALAYATSNRGGCHLRAYPISHEILRKPVATDRFTFEGKARIVKIAEDLNAVVDSLTACKFVFFAAGLEEYAKALAAVTGEDHDVQSLLRTGERIWNLERSLNERNGIGRDHDDLPSRFFTESGSSSAMIPVPPIRRSDFLAARQNYYRIRGWE